MLAGGLVGLATGLYFALAFLEANPAVVDALARLAFGGVVAVIAGGIALLASITIGLAIHAVLMKGPWRNKWPYIIAGATVGGLLPLYANLVWRSGALLGLWGVPTGALTGYFFWLIRRPDRDPPASPDASAQLRHGASDD
ncbi:MAG: hypothetical protein AB7Q23_03315 [Hyphomonadaceae bacterium]